MRLIVVNQCPGTLEGVRLCHRLYISNPDKNVELWRQDTWLYQDLNSADRAAFAKIAARAVNCDIPVFVSLCV
jgi:hypothetical protein